MAQRQERLAVEMRRVVESTLELVQRTGNLDPSIREILAHTGLSTQSFYRYFRSKDELMLALLDDGRSRLVEYLEHRMAKAAQPASRVRAWIEGVMAQAADPGAAARTRPFSVGEDRLAEMFPEEHRRSVESLASLLIGPLEGLTSSRPTASSKAKVRRDARAIYRLTFATLHDHLISCEEPAPATVEHLVTFALRGAGATR